MMLWMVQGYQENTNGNLIDVCEITLHANTEDEAIRKAKKIIKKKYFRIARVNEEHPEQLTEAQVVQLEMQKQMLDAMKGSHGG